MNLTLKEYLMQKKLFAAAELLENSGMTVSEIADQLGFSSPHTFSLAFKRGFALSPAAYRKSRRAESGAQETAL